VQKAGVGPALDPPLTRPVEGPRAARRPGEAFAAPSALMAFSPVNPPWWRTINRQYKNKSRAKPRIDRGRISSNSTNRGFAAVIGFTASHKTLYRLPKIKKHRD